MPGRNGLAGGAVAADSIGAARVSSFWRVSPHAASARPRKAADEYVVFATRSLTVPPSAPPREGAHCILVLTVRTPASGKRARLLRGGPNPPVAQSRPGASKPGLRYRRDRGLRGLHRLPQRAALPGDGNTPS